MAAGFVARGDTSELYIPEQAGVGLAITVSRCSQHGPPNCFEVNYGGPEADSIAHQSGAYAMLGCVNVLPGILSTLDDGPTDDAARRQATLWLERILSE